MRVYVVCVCKCVRACVCVHTIVSVCCACMHVCTCMCAHVCVFVRMCLCACPCVCVCACVNAHVRICGNISATRCFRFSSPRHIVSINKFVFDFIAIVRNTILKKAIFYVTLPFPSVYIHTFGRYAA